MHLTSEDPNQGDPLACCRLLLLRATIAHQIESNNQRHLQLLEIESSLLIVRSFHLSDHAPLASTNAESLVNSYSPG